MEILLSKKGAMLIEYALIMTCFIIVGGTLAGYADSTRDSYTETINNIVAMLGDAK